MPSYQLYQILDVWIPSITVGLVFSTLFTTVAVKVGLKFYQGKRRLVNRWLFEILRLAFRDLKRDGEGANSIFGREIGRITFALLVVLTVPAVLSACLIAFWNIYMVEEQIGTKCILNLECFPVVNGKVVQDTPVHNCSHWPRDIEYRCYQLVYSYVKGVSATGGILFFASVMLKVYIATLLAPYNIQNVYCKWLCYCLVITGGCMLSLLFVLLHTVFSHPKDAVFRNATYQIQFIVYAFLLFVVFFITGPLLIYGIECEKRYQKKQEQNMA